MKACGTWRVVATALAACLLPCAASAAPVVMISLDGLRPGDVIDADARGLKVPNLHALMAQGAYAEGVIGVLPTLTYPSHTTLLTGVTPREHGIANNLTFDPLNKNATGWYWYASDIRVPTLWQAAHRAGLKTANIHWPVSVGTRETTGIDDNLPQIWRTGTPDDDKLLAALASPGLLAPLERQLGAYAAGIDESVEGDATRVRFAQAIIKDRPAFTTIYLAGIDHEEHRSGPGSAAAIATIEKTDALVGQIVAAAREAMPDVTIVVVSDHGFLPVSTDINLFAPFVDAGLITIGKDGKVATWEAEPWVAGGTAAIMVSRPDDAALMQRVQAVVQGIKNDPRYHVAQVLDRAETLERGGTADAAFTIALEPGYETGRDPAAASVSASIYKGMHGYLPSIAAMQSTLIVSGPTIAQHGNIGTIDMRAIAPSVARILGVSLPDTRLKPVF